MPEKRRTTEKDDDDDDEVRDLHCTVQNEPCCLLLTIGLW